MRILMVVGARPNFVKIAPLMEAMRRHPDIQPILVHTGQHYDFEMSKVFFVELGIPEPDINLEVGPGTAVKQVAEIMLRLERVMEETQPDLVLVVGDVNSTLAGALAAVKTGRPVAHVEAGLRSFDRTMPEEINRILIDSVSDFLFVTEPSGVENLTREGRPPERIYLVGNVMIDSLRRHLSHARHSPLPKELAVQEVDGAAAMGPYGLVTLHRPATVDDAARFRAVWGSLQEISQDLPLIFPVHPRTKQAMSEIGIPDRRHDDSHGMVLIPPLSYLQFLKLESEATLVITDSGGVQEETTALGVPCLTVRENTERPITISEGTNTLVGREGYRLVQEARKILRGEGKKGRIPGLWDGFAAVRIVRNLLSQVEADKALPGNPVNTGAAIAEFRDRSQVCKQLSSEDDPTRDCRV
jgi:UDP-N-acetylglucosamine 2-epimerase (non-hydrolysing)